MLDATLHQQMEKMMANHPNRTTGHPSRNPMPGEIVQLRIDRGLSVAQACALVHTTPRVWQQWERGDRRMHPAFWELFSLKLVCVRTIKSESAPI